MTGKRKKWCDRQTKKAVRQSSEKCGVTDVKIHDEPRIGRNSGSIALYTCNSIGRENYTLSIQLEP